MPEGRTRGQTTAQTSDTGGVAQQPRFCTSELPLHAFSATPPASECPLSTSPRVMPEGRTRGQTTAQTSDTGGVAQQPRFCTSELPPSTLSVRHRRRRSVLCTLLHGFALTIVRVSPAVKHGAPPPEASVTLYCYDYGCGGGAVVEY